MGLKNSMAKNENKSHVHLLILVLAIVAGATSGIVASLVTERSLEDYAQSLLNGGQLISLSQPKPQALPGTYEEALTRVQESGFAATAFIRSISSTGDTASEWITRDSAVGHGSIVTSDGWVLFHKDALRVFANPVTQAELWILGQPYPIESVVYDIYTQFALVKVDGAGLPTLAFAESDSLLGGEFLFAVSSDLEITPTSLVDGEELVDTLVAPAEEYSTEWEISTSLPQPQPLLNGSGELIAFSRGENLATPIHHLRPFIQSVLRHGEARYAGLGARVASVSDILNLSPEIARRAGFSGAIVSSIVLRSPAAEAGLLQNDVILFVDDVPVSERVSLDELLRAYEPGDEAVLTGFREEEDLEVTITFADASDLVY